MKSIRPNGLALVVCLLVLVGVITLAYWTVFFTSGATQVRQDDAYLAFENAFPLADGWMASCALLGALGLWRGRAWGFLAALIAAACLVYLGCLDVLFNLNEGTYALDGAAMNAEIFINIGSLGVGAGLIAWLWRHRAALLPR